MGKFPRSSEFGDSQKLSRGSKNVSRLRTIVVRKIRNGIDNACAPFCIQLDVIIIICQLFILSALPKNHGIALMMSGFCAMFGMPYFLELWLKRCQPKCLSMQLLVAPSLPSDPSTTIGAVKTKVLKKCGVWKFVGAFYQWSQWKLAIIWHSRTHHCKY